MRPARYVVTVYRCPCGWRQEVRHPDHVDPGPYRRPCPDCEGLTVKQGEAA